MISIEKHSKTVFVNGNPNFTLKTYKKERKKERKKEKFNLVKMEKNGEI